MLAAMISSVFSKEELSKEDIEKLKEKSALQDMMEELAGYRETERKKCPSGYDGGTGRISAFSQGSSHR